MSTAHILVVDDEADIRTLLKEILSEEGYEVDVAANAVQARASRARQTPDLVLLDIWMPDVDGITLLREWSATTTNGCPVVMMSGHGTVETAVEATRLGAFDFVEKPLSLAKLLRTVERALDAGKRRRQSGKLMVPPLMVPVGKSKLMQQLRAELQQIAANPSSVLLVGEPGTGREAFARYLHEQSPRASQPVRRPGRERPARSGRRRPALRPRERWQRAAAGLLEEAGGGTLFINQIEDLPAGVQRALVGVLESGRFTRVGGSEPVAFSARVRVVRAAGHRDPRGRRRASGATCSRTSTRSSCACRRCASTRRTCRSCCATTSTAPWIREGLPFRRFSVAAQNRLRNYPWPDNVRELKTLVHRLLIQGGAEEIRLEEIERELAVQAPHG